MSRLSLSLACLLSPAFVLAEEPADLTARVATLEKQVATIQATQDAQAAALKRQDAKLDRILDALTDVRSQLADTQSRPQSPPATTWTTAPAQPVGQPVMVSSYGSMAGMGSAGGCGSGGCGGGSGGRMGFLARLRGR